MHIGRGIVDVAQAWGREFSNDRIAFGYFCESPVSRKAKSIVVEILVTKEGTAMAMKIIGSISLASGVVLGKEKFQAALFYF